MTAHELLPLIKAKGRSDRYSENMMKWVKRWGRDRPTSELNAVFLHWNNIDGSHVDMVEGTTQAHQILIGNISGEGWFSGARLSCILGQGTRAEIYAFGRNFDKTVLPNWFEGYISGGKCFIDPEHRLYYDKERWQVSEDGKIRHCLWCGEVTQHKRVKRRVIKDTYWEVSR